MLPLFASMKMSPFQPLLHPKYYSLHTEIVQTQEITGQNLKSNLRSLMNIRNLLNNNRENNNNQNNNINQEEVEGGIGLLGPRGNAGGNVFERGGFWVFKILQIVILWQLVSLIFNHISKEHILIITLIVVAYLCIDYFQKRRNNPREEQPRN